MRARKCILFLTIVTASALHNVTSGAEELYGAAPKNIKEHLDRLVRSYPDMIEGHDGHFLILRNGAKFQISDGRTGKTFEKLLESPDIDDMFYARYPGGAAPEPPAKNADPGRVRFEPLFVAMYGDCNRNGVARNLRSIRWIPRHGGGRVAVTTANGVAGALEQVSRELDQLPGDLVKFIRPTAGTYSCRKIAGSRARSMHAYGAAIDISTKYANYWRWDRGDGETLHWRNRIPIEVVRIFERHGFIWGGYWYHYDTMHFEYRPELLGR